MPKSSELPAATSMGAETGVVQGGVTKRLLAAALLVGAAGPAGAQGVQGPIDPDDPRADPGRSAPAGTYRPETYGAVGDGASRTAGDALGITTRAQLAAYVVDGTTPYAWIETDLWKNYVNLDLSSAAPAGAVRLRFASTAGVTVGMRALGAALAADATVTAVAATSVTLSAGLTAHKQSGMTVSFQSSLTDAQCAGLQMDGLALQAAVEAARAAGGGTVVGARATYLCDRTIILPERGEDAGQQVNFRGAGHYLTGLRAKDDFGARHFLLSCGDPAAAKGHQVGRYGFNYYEGDCSDFRLEGPNRTAPAPGTAPCDMQGFAHGARRACHRVWSTFFRHGWNLVGDHSLFSACVGQYCYYGAYVDDANPVLYGDYRFEYCFFTGNSFAGIGVSPNALLNGLFIKPYWGGEAHHIVGEAGPGVDYGQPFGGSPATPIIQGSAFHLGQWEWAGNGSITDLNADRTRPLVNVSFHGGYWSWNTSKAIAGRGQDYYFDYGASEGVTFYDVNGGAFAVTAGQLGFMRTNAVGGSGGGLRFQGAMQTVLDKYGSAGLPFIAEAFGRFSEGAWRKILIEDEGWTGRVGMVGGTAAVPVGTVLEAGGDAQGVRPSTGGGNPLVGIVVCGVPAVGAAADRLVVYAAGNGLRARWGAGANTAGQWVKSTGSGTLQPATGKEDGQVVGWVWHANGGGMNSPTIQTVFAV